MVYARAWSVDKRIRCLHHQITLLEESSTSSGSKIGDLTDLTVVPASYKFECGTSSDSSNNSTSSSEESDSETEDRLSDMSWCKIVPSILIHFFATLT